MNPDSLPDEPSDLESEPSGPSEPAEATDLDFTDLPCTDAGGDDDGDESAWEAFVPDEDEWDPQPEPGDFWIDNCNLFCPAL